MPEIGEIYISIKGKSTDLQKTLDDSKNASAKAGQAAATAYAERFQATMKSVGSAMSASITAPLLGIGIAASKLSMDFGDAMAKVEGAAGAGHAEVVKLRDAVLDLGGATGKAPKELADALYYIESKSFRGAKAMEILGSSAKLSATGRTVRITYQPPELPTSLLLPCVRGRCLPTLSLVPSVEYCQRHPGSVSDSTSSLAHCPS